MSHFRLLVIRSFLTCETFKSRDTLKICSLQHSFLAPFSLIFDPSPLQLKSMSSAGTEIKARNFSHIRTNACGAAEASPALTEPASGEKCSFLSASRPQSLGLFCMTFSLKRIAASLTCLCGIKKHDA